MVVLPVVLSVALPVTVLAVLLAVAVAVVVVFSLVVVFNVVVMILKCCTRKNVRDSFLLMGRAWGGLGAMFLGDIRQVILRWRQCTAWHTTSGDVEKK